MIGCERSTEMREAAEMGGEAATVVRDIRLAAVQEVIRKLQLHPIVEDVD